MSKPRYLADEDLRYSIVRAVRRMEPNIEMITIPELHRASATDEEVLKVAWEENWIVVSHDVNTLKAEAEQRVQDGRGTHGVLLVPQTRGTRAIAESLVLIWNASEFEEWRDRIVYLPL